MQLIKKIEEQPLYSLFFNKFLFSYNFALLNIKSQQYFFQYAETKIRAIVNYNVVAGDIIILNVDSTGEVDIKTIPLNQNSRLLGYCRMRVMLNNNKAYLIHYDHTNNFNLKPSEKPEVCDLLNSNTQLVGYPIDLETGTLGEKTLILDCKNLPSIPRTTEFAEEEFSTIKNNFIFFSYSDGYLYKLNFE